MTGAELAHVEALLADTDVHLAAEYRGTNGARQPVHTVYLPADRFTPTVGMEWVSRHSPR